jgi:hypothetical protein
MRGTRRDTLLAEPAHFYQHEGSSMKCQAPKRLSMFVSPTGWVSTLRQRDNGICAR